MDRQAIVVVIALLLSGAIVQAGMLADRAAAADARQERFVEGVDGWRFLPAELRFADKLASPGIVPMIASAAGIIADFAAQLKDAGVRLVVIPVPPKALVEGAALGIGPDEAKKMREGWRAIMEDLASRGVQAIDLLPDYDAAQAREPVFCRRDTHWSGHGIEAAVIRLVAAIKGGDADVELVPWKETSIHGDLGGEPEKVKLRFPGVGVSARAPLLLLGDSHVLVFHQGGDMHAVGAGLPEQAGVLLGAMPGVMGVRGSGATSSRMQLARRVRSEPGYLKEGDVVAWVFAGREFTEADMWKKVPIFPRRRGE